MSGYTTQQLYVFFKFRADLFEMKQKIQLGLAILHSFLESLRNRTETNIKVLDLRGYPLGNILGLEMLFGFFFIGADFQVASVLVTLPVRGYWLTTNGREMKSLDP